MGTESQGVDYSAVLADLEARKVQLESAIAVIKGLMSTGLSPVSAPGLVSNAAIASGAATSNGVVELQSDAFFGLSILEAAKKYLAMRKRPLSGPEIVEALRTGGQINAQNENFGNTLGATLSRSDASSGSVVRVGRGKYGLRDWYANKPRSDSE